MGIMKLTTPPWMQSRLLFASVIYTLTTVFLSLIPPKCLFNSPPFDPIQPPPFSYPPSYGEHKYAIPTLRSTCSSPISFSDYSHAAKEILEFCSNSTSESQNPKYIEKKNPQSDSFGGNFTAEERLSHFRNLTHINEIPCGFLKPFPVSNSDQILMENSQRVVVVSALFNNHDKIRQPKSIGPKTLELCSFFMFVDEITFQELTKLTLISPETLKIGVWRIIKVSTETLYPSPAMNGVIPKYLLHRLFPRAKFSIWVDAKLQLRVDPLLLIHSLLISKQVDLSISKHPFFLHTMEEAYATARWRKWLDVEGLRKQMDLYCSNGLKPWSKSKLPYESDVPDSALILRKHGGASDVFNCFVFNEMEAFSHRDQLSFAFVRDLMRREMMVKMFMFEVEVFEQVAIEFRHIVKKNGDSGGSKINRVGFEFDFNRSSKCDSYLREMWGESLE